MKTFLESSETHTPTVKIICTDRSGSMSTNDYFPTRLAAAKKAYKSYCKIRSHTHPHDLIIGIAFNHSEYVFLEPVKLDYLNHIDQAINSLHPDGGTISAGIKSAQYYADYYINYGLSVNIIILSDGFIMMDKKHFQIVESLKSQGVIIDTVGIAGSPKEVDEALLKKIATTDPDGYIHYHFLDNTEQLIRHYQSLATGLRIDPDKQ